MQLRNALANFGRSKMLGVSIHRKKETGGAAGTVPPELSPVLLRSELFRFAFVPHHFERTLRFLVGSGDLLLHLRSGLFHLGREADVAVVLHAGSGGDEAADDNVLLEAAQVIDSSLDGSFGQHARGLLEGSGGDERIRRERSLRDTEEQRATGCRTSTFLDHALVLFGEAELIDLLFKQERRVADVFHLAPTHHLPDDHLDVLVADVDALQPIDFLDFVYQVSLQLFFAEDGQDVVRVERPVRLDALAFLHVDVDAARHRVFLLRAVIGYHVDFALALRDLAELHRAIDFADDRGLVWLAGFEQLDHARQTTGDVLGLGGFARDLCQDVAWRNRVAIGHHQVGA